MPWVLLDVLIALVALAVLGVVLLRLWRRVKALFTAVGAAGEALGVAGNTLSAAQAAAPPRGDLAAYAVGTSNEERA